MKKMEGIEKMFSILKTIGIFIAVPVGAYILFSGQLSNIENRLENIERQNYRMEEAHDENVEYVRSIANRLLRLEVKVNSMNGDTVQGILIDIATLQAQLDGMLPCE